MHQCMSAVALRIADDPHKTHITEDSVKNVEAVKEPTFLFAMQRTVCSIKVEIISSGSLGKLLKNIFTKNSVIFDSLATILLYRSMPTKYTGRSLHLLSALLPTRAWPWSRENFRIIPGGSLLPRTEANNESALNVS